MYFKLRGVQRRRDKLFGIPKESSVVSSPDPIPLHTSLNDPIWPRILKHKFTKFICKSEHDKHFTTISEIVSQVKVTLKRQT